MAAPFMVCAAIAWASDRFSPSATDPLSKDSTKRAKNAGVLPQSAVQASNWAAGICVTVPMALKSHSTSRLSDGVALEHEVMTVVDERTKDAVFGIARTMDVG